MIKYFCDWCNKESSKLFEISFPEKEKINITNNGKILATYETENYNIKTVEVCENCLKNFYSIINIIKDPYL